MDVRPFTILALAVFSTLPSQASATRDPYDLRNTRWSTVQLEKIRAQRVGSDRALVLVDIAFDANGAWTAMTNMGVTLTGTLRTERNKNILTVTSRTALQTSLEAWLQNLTGIANVSVTLDPEPIEILVVAKDQRNRDDTVKYKVKVGFTATAPGQPVVKGKWQAKGAGTNAITAN